MKTIKHKGDMKISRFSELEKGSVFAYPFNGGIEIYYKLTDGYSRREFNNVMFLADSWDDDWEGDYFYGHLSHLSEPTLVKPGDIQDFGDWVVYKLDKRIQNRWKKLCMKNYGKELILDLHYCDPKTFTRKSIKKFFKKLSEVIDMQRETLHWWDFEGLPKEYANAPPHLKGRSAVQFIRTSNIIIHTLDDLKQIYINIFSCKDFNVNVAKNFSKKYFKGKIVNYQVIERV